MTPKQKTLREVLNDGVVIELVGLFEFDASVTVEKLVRKFNLWSRYCFPQFFKSQDAPFHKQIDTYNAQVYLGEVRTFTDLAFRGAAKTTRTKLFFAFCIAADRAKRRKYFKILSEDPGNAKQSVTDIYNLMIDPTMRALFPEVFQKTEAKREETMSSFTTATGIKLLADSVRSSQRGQLQDESRPDVIWFDDFETRATLKSAVVTNSIWDIMEEARTGLSIDGGAIYTANYLSERGNVHKLVLKEDDQNIVLNVPIWVDGVSSWPSRYSIEAIKQLLASADDPDGEYLGKPSASRDILFDRDSLDAMPTRDPMRIIADMKLFKEFNPSHRYGMGADVGGGVGLDSSTTTVIDFDTIPCSVVATFKSNTIKPDNFGDELARQGDRFGECLIAVEKNNHGHATIGRLKQIYALEKIYQTERPDDRAKTLIALSAAEYGWETNAVTKPKMLYALAKAVEDGLLTIPDKDVKAELRGYTRNDLMDPLIDVRLTTRHFDFLMALAITWQLKSNPYLEAKEKKDEFIPRNIRAKQFLEFEAPIQDPNSFTQEGENLDIPFDE